MAEPGDAHASCYAAPMNVILEPLLADSVASKANRRAARGRRPLLLGLGVAGAILFAALIFRLLIA